ncbi:beta-ketoacyl synthase N-terminal-like domain-containing protein [Actinacidiphila sp. DG2A-62]|nr:beta-ketoacyl synthase N-terminal-like domain-containing protein [Actinacidiphila sp. DG2A-62]MEC3998650.1 beta-ketoacyl synthase N-terminal-like domain-containing protein [Actinacidiphila sp. DG2A-62]
MPPGSTDSVPPAERPGEAVAVVGMGVRLPGADTPEAFWRNLRDGVQSLTTSTDEDLAAAGLPPEALRDPARVRTRPVVDGAELFDAAFFGYSPAEAAATDPQHRLLLACAWEALESAGHDPRGLAEQSVGVFAGAGPDSYFQHHLRPRETAAGPGAGQFQHLLGNSNDFLASRVSFTLDLTGPSVTVQAGCSTSLVAVHLAAQSLLGGECDLALAGGATLYFPQRAGDVHREGGVNSRDGRCRPFDAAADGTTPGDGVAVLALRRLSDALAAGDPVLGVIRGTAVNNDGAAKAGFTAPAVEPQADVAAEALAVAGLSPADIDYVEAHGTGTPMGDALEIAALSAAYAGAPPGSCRLGSVKPNVGDTWAAAGAVGLVKVLLALDHEEVPPLVNFTRAHPEIDLASSPFRVAAEPTPWKRGDRPRRAAVHTFGMGGTNAHVIVEEPPRAARTAADTGDGPAFVGDSSKFTGDGPTGGAEDPAFTSDGSADTTDRPAGTAGDPTAFADDGSAGAAEGAAGAAAAGDRPAGATGTAGTTGGPASAPGGQAGGVGGPAATGDGSASAPGGPVDAGVGPAAAGDGSASAAGGPVDAGVGPAAAGDGSASAAGGPVDAGVGPAAAGDGSASAAGGPVDAGVGPAAAGDGSASAAGGPVDAGVGPAAAGDGSASAAGGPVDAGVGPAAAGDGSASAAGGPVDAGVGPAAAGDGSASAAGGPVDAGVGPAAAGDGSASAAGGPVDAGVGPAGAGDGSALGGGPAVTAGDITARRDRGVAARRGPGGADGWWVLPLSARTDAAVRRQAALLAEHLERRPQAPLDEVCRTLLVGRARFARRAVALGRDRTAVLRALRALASGGPDAEVRGDGWAAFGAAPGVPGVPGVPGEPGGAEGAGAPAPGGDRVTARTGAGPAPGGPSPDRPPSEVLRRVRAWVAGGDVLPAEAGPGRRAVLPTYPFERTRHFVDPPRFAATRPGTAGAARGTAEGGGLGAPSAHARPALETPYAPAADRLERLVVDAWGDALGIDGVGRDDDFFELGGHSLLAARVTTTLRAVLPVTTDVTDVLAAPPTAAGHADRLRHRLHERLAALSDEEAAALAGQLGGAPGEPAP